MKKNDYAQKMNHNRKKRRAAGNNKTTVKHSGKSPKINSEPGKYPQKRKGTNDSLRTLQEKYSWITTDEEKEPAPNICPLAGKCGGCAYQGISYEEQLEKKYKRVNKLLKRYVKVLPIKGMEHPLHYRNKVHAVFARTSDGTIKSGIYQEGTHHVVNVDSCQIEDETADKIIVDIRGLLKSFKIKIYDEDTQYGLLRHVLIRRGFASGQVMVVLVLSSPVLPSKNNFVKALRILHPEITTVVLNVNDRRTSMVLGERNITLYGKGYIEDTLCGCTFRISPTSFYQVNPVQTEFLYRTAIDYAGLSGSETVIDAYCGIGTIGLTAAKYAKKVIGTELNPAAVHDAIVNARINGIKNIYFYNQDAGAFITEYAANDEAADIVFMDPPRNGSTEEFLDAVVKLRPARVVYVSCNPETLAGDVKYLAARGYEGVKCQPIDMFPFSEHVECVVLMSRIEK